MKAILEFDLPEEQEEFEFAQKGISYKCALDDFGAWLRQRYKHTSPPDEATQKEFEVLREMFWEIRQEHGV